MSVVPIKYAGMERDLDTGKDYDHARFRSTYMGRFLGVDLHSGTPEDPMSWNRYRYARDNPVKLKDENGLEENCPTCGRQETKDMIAVEAAQGNEVAQSRTSAGPRGGSDPSGILVEGAVALTGAGEAIAAVRALWNVSGEVQERSIDNPASLRGASDKEIRDAVPDGWKESPTRKGDGVRFDNPERDGDQVRMMDGKATNSDPVKRGPYATVVQSGKESGHIPMKGNPTLKDESLWKFLFWNVPWF